MKLSKLLFLAVAASTLAGCDLPFGPGGGGGDGKIDARVYHLKLSSNIASVSADSLKATYAYGVNGKTVTEGVRDPEDIEELKKAGATDADIEKAGKRQDDGSYFFFDGDPMYLESPNSFGGYKYKGFYDKNQNDYVLNQYMTGTDGNLPKWNMYNRDVNLEARYEKWTYEYYFNNMEAGDTNPNQGGRYCAVDDGVVTLLPATTSNPHKHFVGWEYQDTTKEDDHGIAPWVRLEDGKLPVEYYEETMRIGAIWETDYLKVSFDFKLYVEPEVFEPVSYEDTIVSMSAHGNLTKIDGELISEATSVTKDSEIKMEYGSWLNIFYTLNSKYNIFYFELNGEKMKASMQAI